jgi:hypothetical protein
MKITFLICLAAVGLMFAAANDATANVPDTDNNALIA